MDDGKDALLLNGSRFFKTMRKNASEELGMEAHVLESLSGQLRGFLELLVLVVLVLLVEVAAVGRLVDLGDDGVTDALDLLQLVLVVSVSASWSGQPPCTKLIGGDQDSTLKKTSMTR